MTRERYFISLQVPFYRPPCKVWSDHELSVAKPMAYAHSVRRDVLMGI